MCEVCVVLILQYQLGHPGTSSFGNTALNLSLPAGVKKKHKAYTIFIVNNTRFCNCLFMLGVVATVYSQGWPIQYELAFHHAKNAATWDSISAARNGRLPTSRNGGLPMGQYDENWLIFNVPQ